MTKKLLELIVLLLTFPILILAAPKHTVSGTITDATTGESLIGAGITIKELPGIGASTNAYGYFSLTLTHGNYTLIVSYIGYKQYTQTLELSANKMLQIKLEPNSQQLDEVEILPFEKTTTLLRQKWV